MVLVQAVMESVTPQNVIHEIVTNLIGFKDSKVRLYPNSEIAYC
jgi:hypothetical protein